MNRQCTGRRKDGQRCEKQPIKGATVCRLHGGAAPQVRALAAGRDEVTRWGLGDTHIDPGETLLRLVSQAAARAERYAQELEQLVSESPNLRGALVAEARGEFGPTGEYVRGLALLEAQERDRLANFAAKAIAAGLAERQVRLAEKQGALIADVLRKVMGDPSLGLSDEQKRSMPDVIRRHLSAVSS